MFCFSQKSNSMLQFLFLCVCVCFCGVGRSIFLQIVFLSVGWNPSYRLLLHYSLGKGKGKTSTKTNIAPWSQVESLPLRERSSRPGASFPRQSLAYSIVSLPTLPSLFLKLLTNQSDPSKLLTRATSFTPRSDTSKHQSN